MILYLCFTALPLLFSASVSFLLSTRSCRALIALKGKRFHKIKNASIMMLPGSAGSVSRFKLTIEIANKGFASAELVRHLAPLTSNALMKSLPLQDRVHRYADKFVYIETRLVIGAEKQRTHFRRGDVAYLTSNGSICVFVQDAAVQPMNPLGVITGNIEVFESSQPGDVMIVKKPNA